MSNLKFFVGPWNVHTGAASYGPETRRNIDLGEQFAKFAGLGFFAVQLHDDDDVPGKNSLDIFKALEEKAGRCGYEYANKLIGAQKFQQPGMYPTNLIMGLSERFLLRRYVS